MLYLPIDILIAIRKTAIHGHQISPSLAEYGAVKFRAIEDKYPKYTPNDAPATKHTININTFSETIAAENEYIAAEIYKDSGDTLSVSMNSMQMGQRGSTAVQTTPAPKCCQTLSVCAGILCHSRHLPKLGIGPLPRDQPRPIISGS